MGALKMRPGNGFQTVGSNTSILVFVQDRKPKRRNQQAKSTVSPKCKGVMYSVLVTLSNSGPSPPQNQAEVGRSSFASRIKQIWNSVYHSTLARHLIG